MEHRNLKTARRKIYKANHTSAWGRDELDAAEKELWYHGLIRFCQEGHRNCVLVEVK